MIARDSVWPTMSQRSPSKGGLGGEIWQADTQYLKESMSERPAGKTERWGERDGQSQGTKRENRKRAEPNEKREMTQPERDGEPWTNKWDRKWEPSKWSESERAVKQIGPMGASERTKAALLLIDCRISPISPSGTVVRQWQMEADWTPEQKKGLQNLPWSCPQLWVTTPQHVPCLTGHGQARRKEWEGWGD